MQDQWRWPAGILALGASAVLWVGPAVRGNGVTPEEIETSCVAGIEWLVAQQNLDGSWGGYEYVAHTGLAVLKLETRALELGLKPLDPEYEYSGEVQRGLDYIMSQAIAIPIGVQPAGDPDGDGDGIGVLFPNEFGAHNIYGTGIAMMALAASGEPGTYGETLQDTVDFMAWAQADEGCIGEPPNATVDPLHRGGWRYTPNQCSSDNSNSGYATLGLGYAMAPPPWGFEIVVPQFVKDELSIWIDVMQDEVNGDPDDGGSWYDPEWSWVNTLKTGNLLYEMCLVGDLKDAQRVKDAVDYIERHWINPNPCDTGWVDHRQAMFTMMKGLWTLGIEQLDLDGDNVPETDWFAEVATHLVATQNPDGSWPTDCWGDEVLSTCWALLTLERAIPPKVIPVPFDIKPASCPNPINRTSKGLLPAAIVGTEAFDVTQVDPVTIALVIKIGTADPVEIPVLRWWWEDVVTPYEPYVDKPVDAYACTWLGPDGYLDLTLKFDAPVVNAALAAATPGEVLVIRVRGRLLEEFGGTPFTGEDVVWIVK